MLTHWYFANVRSTFHGIFNFYVCIQIQIALLESWVAQSPQLHKDIFWDAANNEKYANKCRPFFMEKIILPVASEKGGEAVVPIVEEGDEIIVVVGPGTRLLHRPISNVNALNILK